MPFARAATGFDLARVNLLMTGYADRPGKPACTQGLSELGTHAIPCVGEDRPEANAGGDQALEFGECNLRLGPRRAIFDGHAGALEPSFIAGPGLRNRSINLHFNHSTPTARDPQIPIGRIRGASVLS